jgi:hypothetical protein
MIEQNTGSGWSAVSVPPLPPGAISGALTGVTCVTAQECWAVGNYDDANGQNIDPLIEQYNGSAWSIASSSSLPASPEVVLNAVACPTARDCWAVGSETVVNGIAGAPAPLIEHDAGNGWSIVPSPLLPAGANTSGELDGVACAIAGNCWAVGSFNLVGGTNDDPAVIDEDTGDSWSTISTPSASAQDVNELRGVSCPSSGSCWAVGTAAANSNQLGGESLMVQGQ